MADKISIAICMGSSCFARGNKRLLRALENAIANNGWENKIDLSGLRCQDCCNDGPVISLDGQLYKGLDTNAALDVIARLLDVPADARKYSSVRKNTIRREQ